MCNSCLWCASYLPPEMKGVGFYIPAKCPKCHSGSIESIPVAKNEEYAFDYSEQRGVTLEFLGC